VGELRPSLPLRARARASSAPAARTRREREFEREDRDERGIMYVLTDRIHLSELSNGENEQNTDEMV